MDRTEILQVGVDLDYLAEDRKVWRGDKNTVSILHTILRGFGFVALLSNYELKKDVASPS